MALAVHSKNFLPIQEALEVFQNYLVKVTDIHSYNTRYASNLNFHVPLVRSNYATIASISSKKSTSKFWLTPKVNKANVYLTLSSIVAMACISTCYI